MFEDKITPFSDGFISIIEKLKTIYVMKKVEKLKYYQTGNIVSLPDEFKMN